MESPTEMPSNTTAGSTVQEEELRRILQERKQECLDRISSNATPPSELFCPAVFDGWSCWPSTPAGTTAFARCPDFLTGFDGTRMAHKDCEANGEWYRHPESNHVWSNYTTCVNLEDLSWQQHLNVIYETGYAISLIALLLSLAILTYFRSLRCARITLHMNLFASFAVNNALWLIWYGFVVAKPETLLENGIGCRLLHVILHYFLLTNYAWMLCEGFYLHTLLVSAFTSEHKLVKWLMALGWPTPAIIVTIYAILRGTSDDPNDTLQCWIDAGNYTSVFIYPVCVSTLLNLLFLCNIVRVLLTKLRAGPALGTKPSRSMLQAFRATLLLVPLLGLHYLVIIFRPPKGHPWEQTHEVVSAITASFQGLCVAILFCFCNGEVITQFKRKWEGTAFVRKRANSCTATTVSVRWRERRRCDYQSAAVVDPQESAVTNISAARRGSSNHLQVLIKRNDSANDFNHEYQSQC
ncbi:calcitonin gene-related peptide type 1 receptor-like isoform X2 [Athalia rosae]|uniref:calcitonin gene-related peptide type 1 receptor-like isoform X2 n=1 Tax=Athalia rosae TaxID=37344 RepID=UPI00203445DE|nr:calcitonin gene-related peptide type 1 receptor-like isoform X2 [Athalia rosae]XP_048509533.1 calcitonin gene-related peptide type 1 receptor-like isoform X2 [Athalia rosae]XP_048509534.1 calcitonin gene-related peptide type 1 receptor-like isoform X2 [Athalia rosae]XP_048509535.1 calcitonin gene-related peptide type 1 receptor-like isoform X2 [Athalia rosae]XP_048509536.1 calcitonin gene-related peptide type 1 receptor-like isoform X2 [Athalia rosae]XP_048509537.1 calcitonin gene-related p